MRRSTSSALRFTDLHVKNWRNFVRAEIELARRAYLAGPSASGKTNLLDALRFLHDLVSVGGGFQEAVRRRGGARRMRCLAARQDSGLGIVVRIGTSSDAPEWEYELLFNHEDTPRPVVTRERATRSGEDVLVRPDEEDSADPERLQFTCLEQGGANKQLRDLAGFLRSVRYLQAVPQLIREPGGTDDGQYDPFGRDFLEQVAAAPEQTRNARLRLILEALRTAVPRLEQLEMHRDARGRPHLRARYEHWRARGAWQTEDEFSDGTLRLMAILWAVLECPGPLLLEEPELSLHAGVVRLIPGMLGRVQRRSGRQVIVTTHSLDLLRAETVEPEEVALLAPAEEGTTVSQPAGPQEVARFLEEAAASAASGHEEPAAEDTQLGLFEESPTE